MQNQGMLTIGAALLGSCHVLGLDIDCNALATAQNNIERFEDLQARPPEV
jgi:predicted RNA methylase